MSTNCLVSYRSGDMWAPKIEQTEALKIELQYFLDCIENDETPMNDGAAGLRVIQFAGSGGKIAEVARGDCSGMNTYQCIAPDVRLGQNVKLSQFINLYGCEIGDETKIGAFVEVQKNARIGTRCKISSHSFICEGVSIEDYVFIGHGVMFINDTYPAGRKSGWSAANRGRLESGKDPDQKGRIDWFREHDSLQCDSR